MAAAGGGAIVAISSIAGVTAVVKPLQVPPQILAMDIWVMLAASLLLVLFAVTGWRVSRREGLLFLLAYAAYLTVQLSPGVRSVLGLG